MKVNVKNWLRATRPKTLAASVSPVILGSALAFADGTFKWAAALLCAGVALFAQIASNLANDYFDFKYGSDTLQRTGPERMAASGKIAPGALLAGSLAFLGAGCLCGLGLFFFADWKIIFVGVAMSLCVFGYSAGPFPLSRHALGDLAVLIFYGLVPVCFTYYVQAGHFSPLSLWYAVSVGLLSVNILVVNNYRDFDEDRSAGKKTTVVLFGRKYGLTVYLVNLLAAVALPLVFDFSFCLMAVLLFYAFLYLFFNWRALKKRSGPELNSTLASTSLSVLVFSVACSLCLILE